LLKFSVIQKKSKKNPNNIQTLGERA
jgi:hypothetical protein